MSKHNKALWVATGCYPVSLIAALYAHKYPWLGIALMVLFPITALNIKRLWLYGLKGEA